MGAIGKIFGSLVLLGAIYVYLQFKKIPPVPKVEEKWWGPGEAQPEDTAIKPFKINVPDEVIKDLQYRLKNAIPLQPPLEGVNHNYGINTKLLESVVDYWKNNYNWTERQKFFNQYSQFQTNIQGIKLHFIHEKPKNVPKGVQIFPIILLHGFPGSVRELYEIIPFLTTPQKGMNFVFEVIVPSFPGFAFSEGSPKPGMAPIHMAQLFNKLMHRLNFKRYYVQGDNWGATIGHALAVLYPENVIGLHRSSCFDLNPLSHPKVWLGTIFPWLFFEQKEIDKIYPLGKQISMLILESGYLHLQATKPDTVGVALRDSPVGLAAYILEKYIAWTDLTFKDLPDGGFTQKYTMDQLLDIVMTYWVNRSITSAIRLYSATFNMEYTSLKMEWIPVTVPTGCNRLTRQVIYMPESLMKEVNPNLIHMTEYDGGTFAQMEVPDVVAKDVFEFAQKVFKLPKDAKEL